MDHFRRVKRSKMIYEKDFFKKLSNIKSCENSFNEKIISDKTLSITLATMIEKLPQSQKEIIKLRFFENLSFKEIALMNDISINTALGRVRYSLNNLRKTMDKSRLKTELLELV
jgi:RNA polymerase sigma-70 factor (ECF subfamily)